MSDFTDPAANALATKTTLASLMNALTVTPISSSRSTSSYSPTHSSAGHSGSIDSSSTDTESTSDESQQEPAKHSNKGVSAGAAIGGIAGLILLIAGILFIVRYVMMKKRQNRTRMMRSSWFYGGDVAEPSDQDDQSEKRQSSVSHPLYHQSMALTQPTLRCTLLQCSLGSQSHR